MKEISFPQSKSITPQVVTNRPLIGQRAPDFEVGCTATPASPSGSVSLHDYRSRWLILMFYPQDFSLICPTELTAMSRQLEAFRERNADVLAVSTDTVETHERWVRTPRTAGGLGSVKFPLASDPEGLVARSYGVYLEEQHTALRGLFIIDPNSVLQYQVVHNLSTGRSTEEVLRVLQALQVGGLCGENWSPQMPALDVATELVPGSVISHYKIEGILGSGGFATVFRAFDQNLHRTVALKVLRNQGGELLDLQDEARAAAAFTHPNVCSVYAIDDQFGVPMIVMEFLEGQTLSQKMAKGPMAAPEVSSIGCQVASAIAAAHKAGIVHGDLKPSNLILMADGIVKVLDFGLAVVTRTCTDCPTLSELPPEIRAPAGTPGYMAPELFAASPRARRAMSSPWAGCSTIYWRDPATVSGKHPWTRNGLSLAAAPKSWRSHSQSLFVPC